MKGLRHEILIFILISAVYIPQKAYDNGRNESSLDDPIILNGISVPSDFLFFQPSLSNGNEDGKIFISNYKGDSHYFMILENDGSPLFYRRVNNRSIDFKVQGPGLLSRHSEIDSAFILIDSSYNEIDTFRVKGDYKTDFHDFIITKNNTALMIGLFSRNVDMSQIVDGGSSNAVVIDNVIQELDNDHNIIFEWQARNYFDITDAYLEDLTMDYIDYVHINSVAVDFDGHLLISSRKLNECTKINRTTGEIIWRLGGINNQFQFVNEDTAFIYQHDFQPVPGKPGNYTIFDNGYNDRPFSRVVEYKIDTAAMTAEKVWEYRHDPDYYAPSMGNAQRLPNGNTIINWNNYDNPKAMEVTPEGEIVYQGDFETRMRVYRTFRFEWDGTADRPYLLIEQHENIFRLLFNIFGREDIEYYNIYGDVTDDPAQVIASSEQPWYDISIDELPVFNKYYFRVTAVDSQGIESNYSNKEFLLGSIETGIDFAVLGNTTISDASDPSWTGSSGSLNNALMFDGIDDYVNCGNSKSLQFSGKKITIEAWINPRVEFKNSFIVNKLSGSDNLHGYALRITENNAVEFILGNGSKHIVKTEVNSIQLNNWYHLAASYNGEDQKVYINGEEKQNHTDQFTFQNAIMNDLYIGGQNNILGESFSGVIDEVRIWNTARMPEEIRTYMDAELADEYPDLLSGLAGYWQFNEGEGQLTENLVGDDNLLVNGGFTMGNQNWDLELNNDASAYAETGQGYYHVSISDGGSFQSDIVLAQNEIRLLENDMYLLEFDVWADSEKFIGIKFYNPQTTWIDYGKIGAAYISASPERLTYSFVMTENSDDNVTLAFSIGGNDIDIYFDNIILTVQNLTNTKDYEENYPENFSLYQNYPNPFNPATIIEYSLPAAETLPATAGKHATSLQIVNLIVYDILGREIAVLVNEQQAPGTYNIHWDASDFSSGIYFYKLTAGDYVSVKKMLMIK